MSNLFGGGKSNPAPAPQPLPVAPTVEASAEKAEDKNRKKKAQISAGSKSIYTSPLGIGGEAQVARKSLLGQ
jgi:hypothetical protein